MADYSLQVDVEAIDKASKVFNDISKNVNSFKNNLEGAGASGKSTMEGLSQSMQSVGGTMENTGKVLSATVTAPIIALGTAAVKTAADFDTQMSKVQAISGATGKDMDDLRSKAREMGAKTKFSATEAGQAFEFMAMAGWKTGDMLEGVEGIMALAAASGEELGTTSDIVTDALTAFGLSAKDSGHFADVLAAASSNANTNVSMLGESFKYAAPVAGALGISAEDTSIALGLMANSGIKASQAGTALRSGLTNLAKPTEQMQEYMDKYNIALVENEDGSINLRETMISLREKMAGLSTTEQAAAASAIFGKEAMSGWLAIINSSDEDFNKLSNAIDNADGSAQAMADTMQDNLEGQLTILKSQLQELAISFGEILVPVVRDVVSILQNVVDWFNKIPAPVKEVIVHVAAVAAAVGPLLLAGGKLVSGIGKLLTVGSKIGPAFTAIKAAGSALGGGLSSLWGVMMANPVSIVIAALAALVAGFAYLWTHCEGFRDFWKGLWDGIKSVASKAADAISKGLSAAWSAITKTAEAAWDGITRFFSGTWDVIKKVFSSAVDAVGSALDKGWASIRSIADKAWDGMKSLLSSAWDAIKSTVSDAISSVQSVLSSAWGAITSAASKAMDGIKGLLSGAWSSIVSTASDAWSAITSGLKGAWSAISKEASSAWSKISSDLSSAWSDIKSKAASAWDNIRSGIGTAWAGIKSNASSSVSDIKSTVSSAWNSIRSSVGSSLEGMRSSASSAWAGIKGTASDAMSSMRSTISSGMSAMSSTASSMLSSVRSAFTSTFDGIKSHLSNVVSWLKGIFNFSWSLPKIALPHFSISGTFSLNPPSIPTISVSWYRSAYDQAMVFQTPTVFGTSGFGDGSGSEVVVGDDHLVSLIREAFEGMEGGGDIIIPVYIGQERIDEVVIRASQRQALLSGGR